MFLILFSPPNLSTEQRQDDFMNTMNLIKTSTKVKMNVSLTGLWRTPGLGQEHRAWSHCFLASMRTLNIVHTDKGETRKSVDLQDFSIFSVKGSFGPRFRHGEIG